MTKPEDIPQDVWRIAEANALSGLATVAFDTIEQNDAALYALTNVIARAILAARAEEREACIAIAEDEIDRVRQRMSDTSDKPRMLVNQAWGMCGDTASIIRDAIRKRGEVAKLKASKGE